jgi:TRAP-type C4-dicarboxylate transport system permease small subunit
VKFLDRAVEGLCIALLAVISADLLAGIFSRYVLERTFVWYDEVARASFMWLVFLGAAVAVRRGAHFGLHVLVETLPRPARSAALALTPLAIMAFAIAIGALGWMLMQHGASQTTAVMGMPVSWIYAAMPVGGALMGINALRALKA